jgi:hypothetical protein
MKVFYTEVKTGILNNEKWTLEVCKFVYDCDFYGVTYSLLFNCGDYFEVVEQFNKIFSKQREESAKENIKAFVRNFEPLIYFGESIIEKIQNTEL